MQLFVSGETFILIKNDQPVDTCIQSLLTTSYKPKTLCQKIEQRATELHIENHAKYGCWQLIEICYFLLRLILQRLQMLQPIYYLHW